MYRIDDAIVHGGKITLSQLPFADGQHVRVLVDPAEAPATPRKSIHEIRSILKGGLVRFDAPLEPMIPGDDWEMLK